MNTEIELPPFAVVRRPSLPVGPIDETSVCHDVRGEDGSQFWNVDVEPLTSRLSLPPDEGADKKTVTLVVDPADEGADEKTVTSVVDPCLLAVEEEVCQRELVSTVTESCKSEMSETETFPSCESVTDRQPGSPCRSRAFDNSAADGGER